MLECARRLLTIPTRCPPGFRIAMTARTWSCIIPFGVSPLEHLRKCARSHVVADRTVLDSRVQTR